MATIAAAALPVACGGDGDRVPRSTSALVDTWLTHKGEAGRCGRASTPRLVRELYGGERACAAYWSRSDTSPNTDEVRQRPARVSGNRATVTVTFVGGGTAGVHGRVALVRHAGTWRVDALGTDLLRDLISRGVLRQIRQFADPPGLRVQRARACVHAKMRRRPKREFRRLAYATIGGHIAKGVPLLEDAFYNCLNAPGTGPGGQSYFRARLTDDVVKIAPHQASVQACIRRSLSRRFTDAEVREHVARDQSNPPPATTKLSRLVADCAK